jgi:large subunit ribosomal protein L34e
MPRPAHRNDKIHLVKTPGGIVKIHYEKPKRNKDKCAICKSELHGTYHGRGSLSKSSRRVKRPYGGHLCPNCLKNLIESKVIAQIKI